MKTFMWIFSLLVSSMLFVGEALWVSHASGQSLKPQAPRTPDEKTTITSKRMTVKNQESRAIFEGAVVLTRGTLIVHSDVMIVTFQAVGDGGGDSSKLPSSCRTQGGKSGASSKPADGANQGDALPAVSNRSICLMEAIGHVTIEKDDGRATGQKAIYYVTDRRMVLTGDPVACQRGTRVSGERITMFLDEDRSEVEGGSQVMINPEAGRC